MVSTIFVLATFEFFCQMITAYSQITKHEWTFLEELQVFSKLKRGDCIIRGKINHKKGYKTLINELYPKKFGIIPYGKLLRATKRKTPEEIRSEKINPRIPYEILTALSLFYVTNIVNDAESRLLSKLESQLVKKNGEQISAKEWIQSYVQSNKNSKTERGKKVTEFLQAHYEKTIPPNSQSRPRENKIKNICKMISRFAEISYAGFTSVGTDIPIDGSVHDELVYRSLYRCTFLLENCSVFQLHLMPMYAPPFGYGILYLIGATYYLVDYVRSPSENEIILGHELVDPSYPIMPSHLKFSYDDQTERYNGYSVN